MAQHLKSFALTGRPTSSGRSLYQRECTSRAGRASLCVRAVTTVPSQYKTVSPVGDRVFVKVDVSTPVSTGGILLPTSAQKKSTQGEVMSLGEAKSVKAGDKVVYSKYAGTEVAVDGSDFVLLKEEDIIGVLNSDNITDLLPLGDRVLIEVAEVADTTSGGLLLTSASSEKPSLGKVVAVGSGRVDEKTQEVVTPNVQTGSTVLYSKYSGTDFAGNDDKQYIVVKESDIIASLA